MADYLQSGFRHYILWDQCTPPSSPERITAYRTPHCLKIKVPVEAKVYRRAMVDGRGRPYKIVMPLRAARVGLVARAIKALRQGIETQ